MLYYGNHTRQNEINHRTVDFQLSNRILEPNFDPRPVQTRHVLYPMVDERKPTTIPIHNQLDFNIENDFHAGNAKAPINGYKPDAESCLQNRFFALQRSGIHNYYIPSSQSDLYRERPAIGRQEQQTHPLLKKSFVPEIQTEKPSFLQENNIGNNLFHNHTRTQLRL